MTLAGARHGDAAAALTILLGQHVRANRLGKMLAAETGFRISRDPDTVRAPDVSFVARERVPPEGAPEGYWDLAPDLVAEVVYPDTRSVVAYESLKEISTLTAGDALSGGDVVPGFECLGSEIFA